MESEPVAAQVDTSSSATTTTSLLTSDTSKIEKVLNKIEKLGSLVSLLAYVAGIVYFCLLPHKQFIHGTYISENALIPGLVSSDIYSSDMINTYYDLLKSHYEIKKKEFDMKFIHEMFVNNAKIEAYIQTYNVTNPFYDPEPNTEHLKTGRNVYAYARSQRADGTESIVVSAPLYAQFNNKLMPNFLGIAQLFQMADLAKNQPYWAKDMIFVVTELSNYGMQAWVNSYYDIQSEFIRAENLVKRGGSIQAALNLEFPDIHIHKLELKLEGANGKLPNLDLFNTIIRICGTIQVECSLESEKNSGNTDYSYYNQRPKLEMLDGIENTINMVFKQASGVPSSMHGYFLNHRIEALTISGARSKDTYKKQNPKQNLLKATRVIESTLRSINNLLERFHQSFFFYLLPSSHYYISIGMYMPVFGLIALPALLKAISIWFSIFKKQDNVERDNSTVVFDIFSLILPNLLFPAGFGLFLYFGSPYFIFMGKKMGLAPKESIIVCYLITLSNILIAPLMLNLKSSGKSQYIVETSQKLLKFIILLFLVLFLGTLSLLNFSLALLLAIFYVPVSLFAISQVSNKILKLAQLLVLVIATPLVYFSVLYLAYLCLHAGNFNMFNNLPDLYQSVTQKFYSFIFLSKICNIWTQDLVHLCLIPIWSSLWFVAFPKLN